jgi:hypothetical protein
MSLTPATIAYRDQLDAAIRDRYDRVDVDTTDPRIAIAILTTIGMVCDAACAWDNHPDKSPGVILVSVGTLLDAVVRFVEIPE